MSSYTHSAYLHKLCAVYAVVNDFTVFSEPVAVAIAGTQSLLKCGDGLQIRKRYEHMWFEDDPCKLMRSLLARKEVRYRARYE